MDNLVDPHGGIPTADTGQHEVPGQGMLVGAAAVPKRLKQLGTLRALEIGLAEQQVVAVVEPLPQLALPAAGSGLPV